MTIEERVEKVETELARARRGNRLLLAGMLLAFVLLTAAMTAGIASREDVVRAKRFVVVDVNDKTRAELSVTEMGPALTMSDENGKTLAILSGDEHGSLILSDKNGKALAILSGDEPGSLILSDKNGKSRAYLVADVNGPVLALSDENGKQSAKLLVTKMGAALVMSDENGNTRVGLGVSKDGPGLDLFDKNDKHRASLGINKTTTPDGKVISYPESSLLLFDPNGNVIWGVPR